MAIIDFYFLILKSWIKHDLVKKVEVIGAKKMIDVCFDKIRQGSRVENIEGVKRKAKDKRKVEYNYTKIE